MPKILTHLQKDVISYILAENEVRQRVQEFKRQKKYPVYFFTSDTTGGKDFEEFYTEKERLDMDHFNAIGIIKNDPLYDEQN
ncbi:MAG: hypothetical protein LBT14_08420 [Treponema sp.]|jgi:glutaredoxin-related protein|nr:hypothetical protein [Treponema sp.]